MKDRQSTFDKSLPSDRVTGILVSAVLALLAGGTGQVLVANFYVGGDGTSDFYPGMVNRAMSSTARMSRETAVLRVSRFSAIVPPPVIHRATDADSGGIVVSEGAGTPVWSLSDVSVCKSRG